MKEKDLEEEEEKCVVKSFIMLEACLSPSFQPLFFTYFSYVFPLGS
jgi:hypothetical protein